MLTVQLYKRVILSFSMGKSLWTSIVVFLCLPVCLFPETYGLQEHGCSEACSSSMTWPLPGRKQGSGSLARLNDTFPRPNLLTLSLIQTGWRSSACCLRGQLLSYSYAQLWVMLYQLHVALGGARTYGRLKVSQSWTPSMQLLVVCRSCWYNFL